MASVTAGTGGTIKSTTAEGQLMEIVSFISQKQAIENNNPGLINNVFATHDQQQLTFAGTYNLPVSLSIGSGGVIELAAVTYLVGTAFQVGTNGTFLANSPEGYLLEVLMYLQGLEQQPTLNPNSRNFVTGTYNSDTGRYQGSFTIPVILGIDGASGVINYGANPYLL